MGLRITFAMLLISSLLISTYSNAQGKKIDIILTVETDSINQNNLDKTCSFGQPSTISNEDFLTEVQMGDEIKWKIKRKDGSSGSAKLVKFKHDNGTRFFKKDSILERSGRIKGVIDSGRVNDIEKYSLEFMVKKQNSNTWENYTIDPKLKLIPSE
ncbi:hypothetical protein [Christiangramia sp.]|uniref:hypothetical protein n=1 Tax=Christiangramia sp. TaxID=1931228 RepID=UPI0026179E22|nr:hypothetical protein [Christiangramia sp.]